MIDIHNADIRIPGVDGGDGHAGVHGPCGQADVTLDGQPGSCSGLFELHCKQPSTKGHPGHPGQPGHDGHGGGNGASPPDFYLEAQVIRGPLTLVSQGGKGGCGGEGGAGGNGGPGGNAGQLGDRCARHCLDGDPPPFQYATGGCGGDAAKGGQGGNGGRGADGGWIGLRYDAATQIAPIVPGGRGGKLGNAGTGGTGGGGGKNEVAPGWPESYGTPGESKGSREPGTAGHRGDPGSVVHLPWD